MFIIWDSLIISSNVHPNFCILPFLKSWYVIIKSNSGVDVCVWVAVCAHSPRTHKLWAFVWSLSLSSALNSSLCVCYSHHLSLSTQWDTRINNTHRMSSLCLRSWIVFAWLNIFFPVMSNFSPWPSHSHSNPQVCCDLSLIDSLDPHGLDFLVYTVTHFHASSNNTRPALLCFSVDICKILLSELIMCIFMQCHVNNQSVTPLN